VVSPTSYIKWSNWSGTPLSPLKGGILDLMLRDGSGEWWWVPGGRPPRTPSSRAQSAPTARCARGRTLELEDARAHSQSLASTRRRSGQDRPRRASLAGTQDAHTHAHEARARARAGSFEGREVQRIRETVQMIIDEIWEERYARTHGGPMRVVDTYKCVRCEEKKFVPTERKSGKFINCICDDCEQVMRMAEGDAREKSRNDAKSK